MKCNEFKENITSLLDPDENTSKMEQHMAQCSKCAEYYRETLSLIDSVTPKVMPNTPEAIKANVLNKTSKKKRTISLKPAIKRMSRFSSIAAAIAIIAAVTILGVVNIPNEAKAANNIFNDAVKAVSGQQTMLMKLNVRTIGHDSFVSIELSENMVPHTISVIMSEPPVWRLEKSGRTAVCDEQNQYMWINNSQEGFIGDRNRNFVEWFDMLLDPKLIFIKEISEAQDNNNKYSVTKKDNEILLTVKAKAQGNFANDYLLNSSIDESNNRRVYTFDTTTKLLKSVKIFVEHKGKEVLILESTEINYNKPLDRQLIVSVPDGYKWKRVGRAISNDLFSSITAEEAARLIFEAMSNNTIEDIEEIFNHTNTNALRETYSGCKIISIGKPFVSGVYPGKFIPYEIRLRNGQIKKHNLALRNDNENKVWVLDGGL